MKLVKLAGPAIVNDALRYPIEGPFVVTNEEADRLKDNDKLDGDPEDVSDQYGADPETPARPARSSRKEA